MSPRTPPRVLAFADVRGSLVAAARVFAPLEALREAGFIQSYVVTDSSLRGIPRNGEFDVIWLQRAADPLLTRHLAARLPGQYLLDVDDHLLCRPEYLEINDLPDPVSFTDALAACRVLTTTTTHLTTLLEQRSGIALASRTMTCPNAIPFTDAAPVRTTAPAAVLLTQGHRLALTRSSDPVLTAIVDGAARWRLPIWTLGIQPAPLREAAAAAGISLTALRPRPWSSYHRDLAGQPTLLGVAPLETRGDPSTLEFVSGKSDVKMVEYGGNSHPGIYSRALPYFESDVRCGRLVENTHEAWTVAVDEVMSGGWRAAADEAPRVRERRNLNRVIVDCWWPAVRESRLEQPIRAGDLLSSLDRVGARMRNRFARARWRFRRFT